MCNWISAAHLESYQGSVNQLYVNKIKRSGQDRQHYLCDHRGRSDPSTGVVVWVSHLDWLLPPPPPCIFSPPIFKPHKILLDGLHWLSTPLQGWPGACKLPLSGWLLYLYWFKLFPLPIHYAGIPPYWGSCVILFFDWSPRTISPTPWEPTL